MNAEGEGTLHFILKQSCCHQLARHLQEASSCLHTREIHVREEENPTTKAVPKVVRQTFQKQTQCSASGQQIPSSQQHVCKPTTRVVWAGLSCLLHLSLAEKLIEVCVQGCLPIYYRLCLRRTRGKLFGTHCFRGFVCAGVRPTYTYSVVPGTRGS